MLIAFIKSVEVLYGPSKLTPLIINGSVVEIRSAKLFARSIPVVVDILPGKFTLPDGDEVFIITFGI